MTPDAGGTPPATPESPAQPPAAAPPKQRRAADQIIDLLSEQGIRTVFGVPGGAIAPLFDALLDHPEIRVVPCTHESMAVFAAAAHARATDGVGVVLVTSGPGVTNAITGLASAYSDSLPVVLLAGEVPRSLYGRGALQEGSPYTLDLRGMVQSITKASFELTSPEATASVLGKALATARSGRKGPVFVSLPIDVTRQPVAPPKIGAQVSAQFTVEAPLLDEVADLLASADRPMILAGSGVRWGRGPEQLLRLAERGRIPVATTPKAKGVFPESHDLALGIYGHAGHASAKRYLEKEVDVLFAVGTSFGEAATNKWTSAIHATKSFLQLDIDAGQIGKNYRADIGLVGPADVLLRQLLERIPQSRRLLPVHGVEMETNAEKATDGPLLKPQRAIWELQRALPEETIYCVDIGNHHFFASHYLRLERPDCFYFSSGLAAMGSSLGAAVGVKVALPDRPVVCICGDGTLSMAGTELLTAAREHLPILFVVFNDRRYGMVEHCFDYLYGRSLSCSTQPLEPVAFAKSLGFAAFAATKPADLTTLDLRAVFAGRMPALVEVLIDPTELAPGNQRFAALGQEGPA